MGEVLYKGKTYYEPDRRAQQALVSAGIYSFRYYPKDSLVVAADLTVENFGCEKFYDPMPQSMAEQLIIPEDQTLCEDLFKKIDQGEKRVSTTLRCRRDQSLICVTITTTDWDGSGAPESAIGIIENPDEKTVSAEMVRALSDDYHSIYYIDFDKNQVVPYRLSEDIEKEYGAFFRSRPEYGAAISRYISRTVMPEDREEMMRACSVTNLREHFAEGKVFVHDFRAVRNDKTAFCRMKAVNLSADGTLHKAIFGFSDISKEKTRELERYAYIDPVTGGDNYVRFKKKLAEKTKRGYIVSMDIHSFKVVNSICGTTKGDEILREIWHCIEKNIRGNDLAAHINADHYIIFYEEMDKAAVSERLEMLTIQLGKRSVELNVPQQLPYFGVSAWEPDNKIEQIYNEANIARHEIKERKDINHAFFSQEDASRILQEKQMEDAFETSIRNHRFEVWYQPKYNPDTEQLVGAEALVRWRDMDGNLVSPAVFIPLFERNGMIRYLDEYVFRTVCTQQKKWNDEGRRVIPVSVNLSRASLYFQNVVERYQKIAADVGVDPAYVPIEITETAALDDKSIRMLADRFYEAGFPLHIDDFGSGYSSFATLNIMHFDTLKLDKSLIDYIGNYGGDRLLEHTIALAKELGMHVTAEGVENETQVAFLQKLNCDSIQGFYYSRPLPLEEFAKRIVE
ncbi:MAG: bifunctional diguanylate cyclase/phosphodiesterase [Lachnospiraceae bacterium]|nr:bifunctional diguanylate cyclase/phosphodiesterase [bacterium]MDY5517810.1 bifunctional diguanylate cyclase/phosphodiesterase [Lachnospiraceae bacterium]